MANLLGYAASSAVLATFLMRTMVPLRVVALLSNVLFAVFGYVEHVYPVLFLHLILLPINSWRLLVLCNEPNAQWFQTPTLLASRRGVKPHFICFLVGLLVGFAGPATAVLVATPGPLCVLDRCMLAVPANDEYAGDLNTARPAAPVNFGPLNGQPNVPACTKSGKCGAAVGKADNKIDV